MKINLRAMNIKAIYYQVFKYYPKMTSEYKLGNYIIRFPFSKSGDEDLSFYYVL